MPLGGALFWVKCIQIMDEFVSSNDGSLVELATPIPVKVKDPSNQAENGPNSEFRGGQTSC